MNRFFHIATNLASALGLILGFALFASTEAREFVLQHGSILVFLVFPLTVLIMLLQILLGGGRDGNVAETPAWKRRHGIASDVTRDQVHPDHHDRLPLRWG